MQDTAIEHGLHAMRRIPFCKNSMQTGHTSVKRMRNHDFEVSQADSGHFVTVDRDLWQSVGSRWCKSAGPSQLASFDERPKQDRIFNQVPDGFLSKSSSSKFEGVARPSNT